MQLLAPPSGHDWWTFADLDLAKDALSRPSVCAPELRRQLWNVLDLVHRALHRQSRCSQKRLWTTSGSRLSNQLIRTYAIFPLQIRCLVLTPVPAAFVLNFFRQALSRKDPILSAMVRGMQDLDIPESPFRPWRDLRWVLAKMWVYLILPSRFRFVPCLEAACHDVNSKARYHTIEIAYQSEPNVLDAHPP